VIQGVVNSAYEAVVRLTVQGPSGHSREIETVIDTGYNGFLTLPPSLVAELGLIYRDRGRAILADGSEVFFDIYDVAVLWNTNLRNTRASAADTTPLVGMRLLDRHSLYVEIEAGGRVVIQARD
jgi:clan AA aspartic protease